jgi:hypothetical protein
MNVRLITETHPVARKHHQCYHCYKSIAPGQRYRRAFLVYDGAYSLCFHEDCELLWAQYMSDAGLSYWSDFPDGSPPLLDEFRNSGSMSELCNSYRGHFPHVICRLEFHNQRDGWDE